MVLSKEEKGWEHGSSVDDLVVLHQQPQADICLAR